MRLLRALLPVLVVFLVAGCGAGSASSGEGTTGAEGTQSRTVDGLQVETVAKNLDTPWEVAFAPDGRIFVTERPGVVRVIESGELREEPYAEFGAEEMGEGGQLGLALDPDFEQNDTLYAYYSTETDDGPENRIARLLEENGRATEQETLLSMPAASIHNGGRLAFGPDGKLYATIGDVSEASLAQDRDALAGKILRINPDGTVPDDNPFDGSPVYSYGHRNPQGLAWDDEGSLYAPEHGQSAHDELNLIEAGKNYGWPEIQGDENASGLTPPILHSGQQTWAPSGAEYVEDGAWADSLMFTGLAGESLHRVEFAPGKPVEVARHREYLGGEYGRLRTVEQGPGGALYVLTSNRDGRGNPAPEDDRLLKVTPAGG
ncbi:PQQ-dependent sugar dehydrogenase [Rubrobacter aplysinae]|uniref:PQQ-dependent sugar dehydrogenase n=1 Tax=Rubrobacter aplysinae TaxID=909625 RepID=UPI00064BCA8E|nr:PQQ-dependent sugar dehydrogenase [Rubrobacter aplysinae]